MYIRQDSDVSRVNWGEMGPGVRPMPSDSAIQSSVGGNRNRSVWNARGCGIVERCCISIGTKK